MDKKVALITGASRGIGKAVAIDLAKQGYHVVLAARSEESLKNIAEQIIADGGSAASHALDVSDAKAVQICVDNITNQYTHIDVLFNNAAILHLGTIDVDDNKLRELFDINLLGAIYVAKAVAKQMKKQRSGHIINVSSICGKIGFAEYGIYCASKFGLSGYSESLYNELLPYNVRVTALCPSFVNTDMPKHSGVNPQIMIQTKDIIDIVNYLLTLESNAAVKEITIECSGLVKKV